MVKFAVILQIMNYSIKNIIFSTAVVASCAMSSFPVLAKMPKSDTTTDKTFTVVLDPGHGGKDYGCIGNITNEKTIVLDVAKKLGERIAAEYPKVNVVYTRSDDRFISLQGRADVANNANGDLFISIHINSVDKSSKNRTTVQGAQVYTLGLHKNDNNLSVAMRENAVIELENDYSTTYQGFDPNSSESYIIFELNQNRHVAKSIELANDIQHELVSTAGRADKDVRQAGFWVLWATSMPSVLVELDFICNPTSEQFLNSNAGKDKCAEALFNAFEKYYERHGSTSSDTKATKAVKSSTTPSSTTAIQQTKETVQTTTSSEQSTYHVQFLTSAKTLKSNDSRIRSIDEVNYYYENGLYKYYSGDFNSLNDAKERLTTVKKKYSEAFIIKLCDGKRVSN
jgi:N-acetylmuramoyl-L-alanine amidase